MVEFHIEGYDCFCSEFQSHHRGFCIYVRSILSAQKLNCFSNSQFKECIFCSLSLLHSVNMIIGIVYRSPNNSESSDSNLWDLFKKVSDIAFSKSHLLITGDFNFPNINWNSWSAPNWDSGANLFLEALDDAFLFQHVLIPTRLREGQKSSTLDLIITNEDNVIENLIAADPLGKSDHVVMEYEYLYSVDISESRNSRYLYESGDYHNFNEELLDIDWDGLLTGMSVEDMWATFHARYIALLKRYVPITVYSESCNVPQWMNSSVSRLIKRKRKAWFKYKSTLSHSNYLAYAKCRNASTEAVRNAKFCFERNLVNGVASNPKRFWKYVHSKTIS